MPISEVRQRFLEEGLCGSCGSRKHKTGKTRCQYCLEMDSTYRNEIRALGIPVKSSKVENFLNPSETRVGVVDIESTGLSADFAIAFCVVCKIYGRDEVKIFRLELQSLDLLKAEKRMLRKVRNYLRGLDGVITYYGTGFDMPFLRTRMLAYGMTPIGKIRHLDLYYTVRRTMRLSRNRLMNAVELLQQGDGTISDKGRVAPALWVKALYARSEHALNEIVEHCVQDVHALEGALIKLKAFAPDRVLRR